MVFHAEVCDLFRDKEQKRAFYWQDWWFSMKTWSLIHALNPGRRGFPTGGLSSLDWELDLEGGFADVILHLRRRLVPDLVELGKAIGVQQLVVRVSARLAALFLHVGFAFDSSKE